jgi:nitroreductase
MMNEVLNLIDQRNSLRHYADKEVPEEVLEGILHSAMRAPTAGNMMMYSIVVIKDQKIKESLSESCDHQPFIAKAPVLLLFLADLEKWHRYFKISGVEAFTEKCGKSYQPPTRADLMLAISDAMAAAQNAVISAESLGLGTCYIGDIMENYEMHKELLNLPKFAFPIAMLTLGYPAEGHSTKRRERFDQKFVVFNDRYRELGDGEIREMFAEQEKLYVKQNAYGADNYAQMFYARKSGSDFMAEMKRSVEEMLSHWI